MHKEGTKVKLTGLPTGFKEQKLKGRTGKVILAVDYRGVPFYAVKLDRVKGDTREIVVANLTNSRLEVI